MASSSWPQLFCHPLFRKGWADSRNQVAPTEQERDSVVYLFGRLMSAEANHLPLPAPVGWMTDSMKSVIAACPAFEVQMMAAQWLQAHGDPSKMTKPLGVKQGDRT